MKKLIFSILSVFTLFTGTISLSNKQADASYVPSKSNRGLWYNNTTKLYYTVTKNYVYVDHNGNTNTYKFRGKSTYWNGMNWHDAYAGNSKYSARVSIAYSGGHLYATGGSTVFQYYKMH